MNHAAVNKENQQSDLGIKSVHLFQNIQLFGFSQTGVQK